MSFLWTTQLVVATSFQSAQVSRSSVRYSSWHLHDVTFKNRLPFHGWQIDTSKIQWTCIRNITQDEAHWHTLTHSYNMHFWASHLPSCSVPVFVTTHTYTHRGASQCKHTRLCEALHPPHLSQSPLNNCDLSAPAKTHERLSYDVIRGRGQDSGAFTARLPAVFTLQSISTCSTTAEKQTHKSLKDDG